MMKSATDAALKHSPVLSAIRVYLETVVQLSQCVPHHSAIMALLPVLDGRLINDFNFIIWLSLIYSQRAWTIYTGTKNKASFH